MGYNNKTVNDYKKEKTTSKKPDISFEAESGDIVIS